MSRRRRRFVDEEANLVELTPMIDVVFLLLIFFMVSTRFFDPYGFEVDLPQAQSAPEVASETQDLIVSIHVDGRATIRGEIYSLDGPLPDLTKADQVIVRGDQNTAYGKVIAWMDRLREAGVEQAVLAAEPVAANGGL
ncbi:MAG: biopolymer transporter ExbD [Candidatus Dadabacteria bacterium]|nr:MAG: biopolymer transporter ExbD [Candidatus Dadabacteria bacterium]